jgi:protein tyrosine/serine phosphatase
MCARNLRVMLGGCRNTTPDHSLQVASHPWAAQLRRPGLANFHQVSDELYRGAQPTQEGLHHLKNMGIATVVNTRTDDRTRGPAVAAQLHYEHIPMSHWHAHDADIIRFLKLFADSAKTPVFLHCEHGADRTGLLCAMYRIAAQGWSKEHAINEMTRGGMGFHPLCANLVKYIRNADVDAIRRAAGLSEATEAAPR